jgi:hypothetical protein
MKKVLFILLFTAITANGEIYTWRDGRGTAHFTNSMDDIPDRYRAKARSMNYGTDQKKEPATVAQQISGSGVSAQPLAAAQLMAPTESASRKVDSRPAATRKRGKPAREFDD